MSEEPLTVDVRPDRDRVIVAPSGALDHFSAPTVRATLDELAAAGWRDVVLDLRGLDFMDSGGVHLLEECRDGLRGPVSYSMVDGVAPVALPLSLMADRVLPAADVGD